MKSMKNPFKIILSVASLLILLLLCLPVIVIAWGNGPQGNAQTNTISECDNPPYSTHDWIADHAVMLLPDEERAWLMPYKTMYLLGTEAPDNDDIPEECNAPNTGYDDRYLGHSIEWKSDWSGFAIINEQIKDRAARRAQEEYSKADIAYSQGNLSEAEFYLGAMAHYIGDVSAYPHAVPFEHHHSDYETWAKNKTDHFNDGHFESYIQADNLVRRRPYTAVKRISKTTAKGSGKILSASDMDTQYHNKDNAYLDSDLSDNFS